MPGFTNGGRTPAREPRRTHAIITRHTDDRGPYVLIEHTSRYVERRATMEEAIALCERTQEPYLTPYDAPRLAPGPRTLRGRCPICGARTYVTATRTTNGRLIGRCGDAFTVQQWNRR